MNLKDFSIKRSIVLMLPFVLFSCVDNDYERIEESNQNKTISISGEIDQVMVTRVSDEGFCDGDVIGAYIVDYVNDSPGTLQNSGNRATNLKHTYDEAAYKWNSAYDVYWKDDKTPIDVYAYYPYAGIDDVNSYSFEIKKDQSKAAEDGEIGNYEASDFLWGKSENVSPTASVIRVVFKHKMANVRVSLVKGTGFESEEWADLDKSVLIMNTKRKATINLADGTVEAIGEVSSEGIIAMKNEDDFRAIVAPQKLAASTKLFIITVNGISYSYTPDVETEYIQGKMHNYSITVNKKSATGDYEFTLTSESITAWENDAYSHDANGREYIVIESEAGQLKEAIVAAGKDYTKLKNLKVTGEINQSDFYFMRDEMTSLQSLNLKEVKIKGYQYEWDTNVYGEDEIPSSAFYNKTSLVRIILPDKLKIIGEWAFQDCKNLTGSIIIPEGVTRIESGAFNMCQNLTGTLSLPSTLVYIGYDAFSSCKFNSELNLPSSIETIESAAFNGCSSLYGPITLPENLKFLGSSALSFCSNLTGNLEIPTSLIEIEMSAFQYSGFNGTLKLHDGITNIGEYAFYDCNFKGELVLPENLTSISPWSFGNNKFSGELKIPSGVVTIGESAFVNNSRFSGILDIPEETVSIGSSAFYCCSNIEGIIIGKGVDNIGSNAFSNCYGIGSIVCKGTYPPTLQSGAFDGVPKDNFALEVPESAVQAYQQASGWNEFKRITAHRELVCRPSTACALNAKLTKSIIIDSEGDWEIQSMPDWCSLSATSGSKKTQLTLTIDELQKGSADRTGEIIFLLTGKDYTASCVVSQYNYEYEEDQMIALQTATKGNNGGINLVFIGDGYDAKDIQSGQYLSDMNQQVEYFFGLEPYKTYREYFNVYTGIALSQESGVGTVNTIRYNKFETTYTGGVGLQADNDAIFEYACKAPTVDKNNLNQTLIVLTPNSRDYGGVTQMWSDGSAIAFCPMSDDSYPYDSRGIVQHEAGGHGFGKLGDEYLYHNAFYSSCSCNCCDHNGIQSAKANGWYDNLSLSGKMNEVPWSHLIFHEKFSAYVDIFEGGYMHTRGVYRSEQNSCMNNNVPYYSAISRESIVKRIKQYAGETYSFEEFLANDDANVGATKSIVMEFPVSRSASRQQPPVIHKGKPDFLKK